MIKKAFSYLKYLDPFHYLDLFLKYLHKKGIKSKVLDLVLEIIFAFILAYLTIYIISAITGADDALSVVMSGSMDPSLHIGDILLIAKADNLKAKEVDLNISIGDKAIRQYLLPVFENNEVKKVIIDGNVIDLDKNGDIVVYYSPIVDKKITHRLVLKIKAKDGNFYLTKGDNPETNFMLDEDCTFVIGNQLFTNACLYDTAIPEDKILGKVIFRIPYIGYIKVLPYKIFKAIFP